MDDSTPLRGVMLWNGSGAKPTTPKSRHIQPVKIETGLIIRCNHNLAFAMERVNSGYGIPEEPLKRYGASYSWALLGSVLAMRSRMSDGRSVALLVLMSIQTPVKTVRAASSCVS